MGKVLNRPLHCSPDFSFGFDDANFSDRTLKLLISDDDLLEASEEDNNIDAHVRTVGTKSQKRKRSNISQPKKGTRVKIVNVNSLLLAAYSPFFQKLFSNGINQREVVLRIHSSEEANLMDVLRFMYTNNLQAANSSDALVQVLITADKFDVPLCVQYCCEMLLSFSMTEKLAFWAIDLPSNLSSIEAVQLLIEAAKDFLPEILRNLTKYRSDVLNLSLNGIKTILSAEELKMDSEDAVYDLFVQWLKKHFPDQEEQRRVYNSEVLNLIDLNALSPEKLKMAVCEMTKETLETMVLDTREVASLPKHRRSYNALLPVATMTMETPLAHCVIAFNLKRDECKDVVCIKTQTFTLDGHTFHLEIRRCYPKRQTVGTFGLFLILKTTSKRQTANELIYEFAARKRSLGSTIVPDYQKLEKSRYRIDSTLSYGCIDLFKLQWDLVMNENSLFFINDAMHLRVELTLR